MRRPPELESLTEAAARNQGYVSMTQPYNQSIERERIWFQRVLRDMRSAKIVLVMYSDGIEVWRHKSELNPIKSKDFTTWKRNMR